jgi:hypothetical protein
MVAMVVEVTVFLLFSAAALAVEVSNPVFVCA